MKKIFFCVVVIFLIGGCGRTKDYYIDNSHDDVIVTDKGDITFSYDEKMFDVITLGDSKLLKNEKDNYKIYLSRSSNDVLRQEIDKKSYASATGYDLEKLSINDYDGYVQFGKRMNVVNLYLFVDKKSDVILWININRIKKSNKMDAKGLFKNNDIQAIINSVKFKTNK